MQATKLTILCCVNKTRAMFLLTVKNIHSKMKINDRSYDHAPLKYIHLNRMGQKEEACSILCLSKTLFAKLPLTVALLLYLNIRGMSCIIIDTQVYGKE